MMSSKENNMAAKEVLTIIGIVFGVGAMLCFIPFMAYVVFPFFINLTPEKRLEKFIDEKCLQGNEIAIRIRREGFRYYRDRDYKIVRAAIEGNVHAVRALNLDSKK